MKDYKDTLNLPKTNFPMKANLPQLEPRILEKWKDLYKKIKAQRKGKELFVLHDGPPYANGHIHIGHALNKILKDVINKYMLLKGYDLDYIPGWDCHGLPIEQQVEKELKAKKIDKESLPKSEFRKLCRDYANKYVKIQKEEFIRLGVIGDWENPYLTMHPSYQSQEVRELGKIFEKGLVVRSKKPVYWCMYDKTAEAEAEVEYYEKEDPSIYVKFPLVKDSNTYLLIWTTTPWTLPANLGVMVCEKCTYVYLKSEDDTYVVAKERLQALSQEINLSGEVLKEVKGEDLVGLEYIAPYGNRVCKVYPSEFVDMSTGTGLVHMAPGHGREDYIVGLGYGLDAFAPVDDEGRFTDEAPDFIRGLRVFDANPKIVQDLKERKLLLFEGKIKHSYPHCWRCKNPVIFRATHQWFISMDTPYESQTLRERALESIKNVKWIPNYGENRIRSMLENRPDWCISRQRYWGVPITVFYCKECSYVVSEGEVFEHIAKLFENSEKGADLWFELSEKELLPKGYKCPKCGSQDFKKEEDILDVWFDSGSSHASVLRQRGIQKADLYLEGSDQHRGWFQASLLESVASYLEAPYKAVLTHGFTVDEGGRKMSKSLGNVVSPQEVINTYGADILRLWVVSEDYTEDVKLGRNILQRVAEDYKKIRNTLRFLLANLYDFDPKEKVPYEKLHHFDRWIVSYVNKFTKNINEHYQNYLFHRVYQEVRNLCSVELSSIYLDVIKDRLYVYAPNSWERKSAQTALWEVLLRLTCTIAPFLSFTAEEVWEHIKNIDNSLPESVFLYTMPQAVEEHIDNQLLKDYEYLLALRDEVMRVLEIARREKEINHPYEAHVYIWGNTQGTEQKYMDYLKYLFTVSKVEFGKDGKYVLEAENLKGLFIGVSKVEGIKCLRCWMYYDKEEMVEDICIRCHSALKEIGINS